MIQGYDIICFSNDWDGDPLSKKHIMQRLAARNRVLWVNSIGGRIQRFSDKGAFLSSFGEEGTGPGQFYAPHGLAIDSHGCLYVVDAFNHRIQKFDVGP